MNGPIANHELFLLLLLLVSLSVLSELPCEAVLLIGDSCCMYSLDVGSCRRQGLLVEFLIKIGSHCSIATTVSSTKRFLHVRWPLSRSCLRCFGSISGKEIVTMLLE